MLAGARRATRSRSFGEPFHHRGTRDPGFPSAPASPYSPITANDANYPCAERGSSAGATRESHRRTAVALLRGKKHSEMVARLALEHKLRVRRSKSGQFELHYQPKLNIVTRRLAGVEALNPLARPPTPALRLAGRIPPVARIDRHDRRRRRLGDTASRVRLSTSGSGQALPPVRVAVNHRAPRKLRLSRFSRRNFLKGRGTGGAQRRRGSISRSPKACSMRIARPEIKTLRLTA